MWDLTPGNWHPQGTVQMRRTSIYPHRSVRSFTISRRRILVALGLALVASILIGYFGSALLAAHGRLAGLILAITGIPSGGSRSVVVFPSVWSATVPSIHFPHMQSNLPQVAILFSVSLAMMVAIYRSFALSRGFVVFLMILLSSSAAAIYLSRSYYLDSAMYHQIWLRGEILVWILIPWASAFLFLFTIPSFATGLAWALLLQVYSILWSAVRLAFCLGVFHYSGVLFLPLLWFCLGTLFDLVYVVLFYSLALHFSFNKILGLRTT